MQRTTARQSGVTLIEVMVSVIIVGILVAMAIPSFNSLLAGWRVKAVANSLMSGIQLARAEAIRRNATVSFVMDATTSNWLIVVASTAPDANLICSAPPSGYVRQSCGEGTGVTNTSNFANVVFDSQGRRYSSDAGEPSLVLSGDSTQTQLKIQVLNGGQVRSCDPSSSPPNATDPRYCANL